MITRSWFGPAWAVPMAALVVLWGCGDDGAGIVLQDLVITTATTGVDIDPDGYLVVVEGLGSLAIGPIGTATFENVPQGSYVVELTGIPPNCTSAGANPRTVVVGSGDALAGRFEVSCIANLGAVEVTAVSDGVAVPDGYTIVLEDTITRSIDANGVTVIGGVPAGQVSAELLLPGNCTIQGENPRTLAVRFGDVAPTGFDILCGPTEGTLEVVTTTAGGDLDPDGYTVVVADTLSEAIGLDDQVTFEPLTPGDLTVHLTDLAANCVVIGDNPRIVSLPIGGTVSTTFEVECDPHGDLEVTASTTGMSIPAELTVSVAGGPDGSVGPSGMVVFPDLPAGDHSVELTGLPEHCEVVDGSNPRTVTVSGGFGSTTFEVTCWGWLVFDSDRTGSWEVFIMRHDGSQQTNLTEAPDSNDRQPVVSPDGTRIAFASTRTGTEHLHVMNRNGTGVQQLTTVNRAKEPYWSPDGARIVFSARISPDQWDIWVIDADGQNEENLTNHSAQDSRPEWSPDGTKIVFDSDRNGVRDVFVMNADGSDVTPLGTGGGGNATWSPDGTRIAYTGSGGTSLDVWVMNADGSGQENLTSFPGAHDGEAAWSPDGTTIAFATERHGKNEIYLMNPDGTNLRRLTENGDHDMWPSWVPIP